MSKKKRRRSGHSGHYCKVCGEWKANERFSGKGHAQHICKDCARLPVEKRNELMTINKIMELPYFLSAEKRAWLAGKCSDSRAAVRREAEWAYQLRYPPRSLDVLPDDDEWSDDEEWLEDEEWLDDDLDLPF